MTDSERIAHMEMKLESASRDKAKLTEALASARTLVAQQAQRADEAVAEANIQCEIRYAETSRAEKAEAELADAQAQAAEMGRALEEWKRFATECNERRVEVPLWAAAIGERASLMTDAALAINPGEALERVKRQERDKYAEDVAAMSQRMLTATLLVRARTSDQEWERLPEFLHEVQKKHDAEVRRDATISALAEAKGGA